MTTIFISNPPIHQTRPSRQVLRKRQYAALISLAALVLLTAILGVWQLWRAQQKQLLLSEIEAQQALPELTWSKGIPPPWRLLKLDGQWLNQAEIMLDQRIFEGKIGYYLITPFQLKDGSIIMVNRGWWSPGERLTPPPAIGTPQIVAQPLPRYFELGDTPIQGRVFQNLDLGRFAAWAHLPLPSAYGVAREAPLGIQPLKTNPPLAVERHLAYALSWWCMSGLGTFLWLRFYRATKAVYVAKE
ncbi:MAG: SURF1 family protein [Deefgea sp.]